jgi:predicted aminopeptidase
MNDFKMSIQQRYLQIVIAKSADAPFLRSLARLILLALGAVLVISAAACSPVYVINSAYQHTKILLARRPIGDVIQDSGIDPIVRSKLRLVQRARLFAESIALEPKGSFTKYAELSSEREFLAWVVLASRRDAFDLYTWWFPFVGSVPYKGFFDRDDALKQAQSLEAKGYEASVRGTEAFSTLGWFNDPLLSTTLRNSYPRVVNTVIHESVHSTVWVQDNVPFNESLANFVGLRATIDLFKELAGEVSRGRGDDVIMSRDDVAHALDSAKREYEVSLALADAVSDAVRELAELYARDDITSAEKIKSRQGVFASIMEPFRLSHPWFKGFVNLNNADLMQASVYMTKLRSFERLFTQVGSDWRVFLERIRSIKKRAGACSGEAEVAFRLLEGGDCGE